MRIWPLCILLFALPALGGAPPPPSVHQLPPAVQNEWRKIADGWMQQEFSKALRHARFKMSCGGCKSLYLAVELSIDQEGHATAASAVEQPGPGCKRPPSHLKRSLLHYLKKVRFPEALRSRSFSARIGTALMC